MSKPVEVVFGAYGIDKFSEGHEAVFTTLLKNNVNRLDTARIYPGSEAFIGSSGANTRFTIDTKAPGFVPGSLSVDSIRSGITQSLSELHLEKVDTYYLHSPDPHSPLEQTLQTIDEQFRAGKFAKLGLSNFTAEDVQKVYDLSKKNGWVLPTVYQGNYNPAARHSEDNLFPTLRKLSIAFRAYSPLAGGFLVRKAQELREGTATGRWDANSHIGKLYIGMYGKPELLDALEDWEKISTESGISKSSLAYRYVAFHSALKGEHGDGFIVGATKLSQLEETLKALEAGPLPANVVKGIEAFWSRIKDFAPTNNYESAVNAQKPPKQ